MDKELLQAIGQMMDSKLAAERESSRQMMCEMIRGENALISALFDNMDSRLNDLHDRVQSVDVKQDLEVIPQIKFIAGEVRAANTSI